MDNGKIPSTDLITVAVGVQLVPGAAWAYRALVLQGAHEHISVRPAPGVGSGYRSLEVQEQFWRATHGDKTAARLVQLNTSSSVKVAAPGGSSHGWGDRIDLLFDGSQEPTSTDLNLAKRFGFTREFGSADSNHFEHDGRTAITPPHPATAAPEKLYYTVVNDDNLTLIAGRHGMTLAALEHLNPGLNQPRVDGRRHGFDYIYPGDKIRLR